MVAVTLAAFDSATREEAAYGLPPPAPTPPLGARKVLALFYLACGHAVGGAAVATATLALHSIRPRSSAAYRGAALDLGAVMTMGGVALAVLLRYSALPSLSTKGASALAALLPLEHAAGALRAHLTVATWEPAWHVATAAMLLYIGEAHSHTHNNSTTPPLLRSIIMHPQYTCRCP